MPTTCGRLMPLKLGKDGFPRNSRMPKRWRAGTAGCKKTWLPQEWDGLSLDPAPSISKEDQKTTWLLSSDFVPHRSLSLAPGRANHQGGAGHCWSLSEKNRRSLLAIPQITPEVTDTLDANGSGHFCALEVFDQTMGSRSCQKQTWQAAMMICGFWFWTIFFKLWLCPLPGTRRSNLSGPT